MNHRSRLPFPAFAIAAATALALLPCAGPSSAQDSPPKFPLGPDSMRQDGVPVGEVTQHAFNDSAIFPGTERDYWVYVPAQYKNSEPACLMVFQDGGGYVNPEGSDRVPIVFDNLIHRGEMPVTIGLFINPGVVPAPNDNAQPRFNRSFEYDGMGDRYARFLIEEMIPRLESEHDLKISPDPDDRGICGASSGAICAFTAAWERPDAFRRVYSMIGTFVGLRGGNEYPTLIRKTEPKPLRIFLEDGSNDLNIYGGDWWMANQSMLSALEWAGYEVEHRWSDGRHSHEHGGAILPDAMRWLWQDHGTTPVSTHPDRSKSEATQFLVPGEDWQLVSDGHQWAEGLAITDDGTLYFSDVYASTLYRVAPDGTRTVFAEDTGNTNGIALGPDGRLYGAASGARQIRAWSLADGTMEVVAEDVSSNDIVVRHDGTIYFTDPGARTVWCLRRETRERVAVDAEFPGCNGITLSTDQSLLFVADFAGRFVYSYQVGEDGSLSHKQAYFHMHVPTNEPSGLLDGMCVTEDGWMLSGTAMGVQICDQPGRVHLIVPKPAGSKRACYVRFGGPERRTLYLACGDKVFRRETALKGADAWKAPIKPPQPRL